MLTVEDIMDGLEDIIDVAGPDFSDTKPAHEKFTKQQQSKLAFKQQNKPSAIAQEEKVAAHTSVTGDEESEGLEFIDPEAEKRAKLAEAAKEREGEVAMIVINGQLMPASNIPGQAKALQKGPKTGRNRFSLINELRNKTLAKRSANFDISKLKGTFQTTDLASKKKD